MKKYSEETIKKAKENLAMFKHIQDEEVKSLLTEACKESKDNLEYLNPYGVWEISNVEYRDLMGEIYRLHSDWEPEPESEFVKYPVIVENERIMYCKGETEHVWEVANGEDGYIGFIFPPDKDGTRVIAQTPTMAYYHGRYDNGLIDEETIKGCTMITADAVLCRKAK